jgi:hypothetical protein
VVADDAKAALDLPSSLCLACGLCCNGVLFKDVELQPDDVSSVLLGHGLQLTRRAGIQRLAQPCQALEGCSCRIYPERPARCRQFECLLFKSVAGGQTTLGQALRIVQRARRQAARVRQLLAQLGDRDDSVPLSVRFRRMRARFEGGLEDNESVDRFGELTLATHELNVLLSEAFLPG